MSSDPMGLTMRLIPHCVPVAVSEAQLEGIHGIDENVDLSALAPAVDFYKYILTEV